MTMIFIETKAGHIFAIKLLEGGVALVTNEYGMQTHVKLSYFAKVMGGYRPLLWV